MSVSLSAVQVDDMRSYLTLSGWQTEIAGPLAELWHRYDRPDQKVLMPVNESASDYVLRLDQLLEDLQRQEQRPGLQIREDMARQRVDVTDLYAIHAEETDDGIPLVAGYELVASAREMVIAAAGSTMRKQGFYGSHMPAKAREYARHVRLGHTRRGSYVVPIISPPRPVGPALADGELDLAVVTNEPLNVRQVFVALAQSLDALHELTVERDRVPTQQAVNDAIGSGVSFELCNAVYGVLNEDSVDKLRVQFRWALASVPPASVPTLSEFPHDAAPLVRDVGERLKPVEQERVVTIAGVVVQLRIKPNEPGGQVWIEAHVDGQQRQVKLELDEAEYAVALASHKRTRIIVTGRIRLVPNQTATMTVAELRPEELLPGSA